MELAAQIIGYIAVVLFLLSYLQKTRMRIIVHWHSIIYGNIFPKYAIQAHHKSTHIGNWLYHIKVCIHHSGIHPGIGASGTGYSNRLSHHHSESLFDTFLHRHCIWLRLPPVIVCAIIGKFQKITHALYYQSFSR